MKIEIPKYTERFGAVRINQVQRIYELDSGANNAPSSRIKSIQNISSEEAINIEKQMVIVIPIMNEKLKLLEGVLSGIPHDCRIIIISNSERESIDRFSMEIAALEQFNYLIERKISIIHQADKGLAQALKAAGYTNLLSKKGYLRSGKGEAMVIGIILAKMAGANYVGFVDSDNYAPGAIHEYIKSFDAAFCMAKTPYSMVRISWLYKPKIHETGMHFTKYGRVSEVSNKFINLLISTHTGFGSEVIKTGNSGDHAMSMPLAEKLEYSSGFSFEPYGIINILAQFGGVFPNQHKDIIKNGVEIFQIETRNPHFHEEKGDEHIKGMLLEGLLSIYHNKICPPSVRKAILEELIDMKVMKNRRNLHKPYTMPPIHGLDFSTFKKTLEQEAETLKEIGY